MPTRNIRLTKVISLTLPAILSCLVLLASGCMAQGKDTTKDTTTNANATPIDVANRWTRFVMMVWQYKTPPIGPEAKQLYESVNLHGIHLDNGFSDDLLRCR